MESINEVESTENVQAKWDNYKWKARSGKECTGKYNKDKVIIILTQDKGKRRQDCLDGAMHGKNTPGFVKQKAYKTALYYYGQDDMPYGDHELVGRDVEVCDVFYVSVAKSSLRALSGTAAATACWSPST